MVCLLSVLIRLQEVLPWSKSSPLLNLQPLGSVAICRRISMASSLVMVAVVKASVRGRSIDLLAQVKNGRVGCHLSLGVFCLFD